MHRSRCSAAPLRAPPPLPSPSAPLRPTVTASQSKKLKPAPTTQHPEAPSKQSSPPTVVMNAPATDSTPSGQAPGVSLPSPPSLSPPPPLPQPLTSGDVPSTEAPPPASTAPSPTTPPATAAPPPARDASEKARNVDPSATWQCARCTYLNLPLALRCEMCEGERGNLSEPALRRVSDITSASLESAAGARAASYGSVARRGHVDAENDLALDDWACVQRRRARHVTPVAAATAALPQHASLPPPPPMVPPPPPVAAGPHTSVPTRLSPTLPPPPAQAFTGTRDRSAVSSQNAGCGRYGASPVTGIIFRRPKDAALHKARLRRLPAPCVALPPLPPPLSTLPVFRLRA